MPSNSSPCITVRQFPFITLESRHNATGTISTLPPHSHEEYQFILTEYLTGEYYYRRTRHVMHTGSLLVIHPGEIHSARGLQDRRPDAPFRTLYIAPGLFGSLAQNAEFHLSRPPFFFADTLQDPQMFSCFLRMMETLVGPASTLEKNETVQSAFAHLMQRHAEERFAPPKGGRENVRLKRIVDLLHEQFTENIALETLAEQAGLSPFYLCRTFCQEFGLPPHRYQTQLRVERARSLLRQGLPVAQVAVEVGFADQAHLTRHFKRQIGVTPGQYRIQQ